MFDFGDLEEEHEEMPETFMKAHVTVSSSGMETRTVQIEGVQAVVRTSAGGSKPQATVVLAPGNPDIRQDHANRPLMLALDKALERLNVAVIRFDYRGDGISAPGGPSEDSRDWKFRSDGVEASEDAIAVVGWARKYLSDLVFGCGWNFGAWAALWPAVAKMLNGYIGIAFGYNVYMMIPDVGAKKLLKHQFDTMHPEVRCPALYILGEKDFTSPPGILKRLMKLRKDQGKGARIETVKGADMTFQGQEDEVCEHVVDFIKTTISDLEASMEVKPTAVGA